MTKPRLAALTVLSLAAYLGLAIAGAGGAGRFFSHPPLIAVTVVTIALGFAALFSEGHIGAGVREDRSNRWVIAALTALGLIDAYLPAYTDRIDFLTFGGDAVRWVGFLALFDRRRASPCAGVRARAPLQRPGRDPARTPAGHHRTLRRHSPPELSRSLSSSRSAGRWRFAPASGVIIAVLMLIVVLARIEAEERLLSETFGAEYDAYRARTWRLVPYLY